jgi:hypothetical protein
MVEGSLMAVGDSDIDRTCPGCGGGGDDGDVRHTVVGTRLETQHATLDSGVRVPVQVPIDVSYHLDCHAAMGCDHCAENLEAHGGSVKGKVKAKGLPKPPAHLLELEPWEFAHPDENGVMRRIRTKDEAREHRLAEHNDPTLELAEG